MVLHPHGIKPIPPLTPKIAHKAFPKGNLYMTLRDELGTFYDEPTTPQWLREIPAIETLRIAWTHQYWINNGQLSWRSHKDLPPAGVRSNSPYDTEARYGNKRHTTWLGYKVHLTETCEKNQIHLITNVQTTEAHLSDVDQTESIHQSLADKELLPSQHIVEGTISQAVRGFDLRSARYIGLDKVHLQHILTATAMNAIRLFSWYEGVPLAKTRVSSFAKLAPD